MVGFCGSDNGWTLAYAKGEGFVDQLTTTVGFSRRTLLHGGATNRFPVVYFITVLYVDCEVRVIGSYTVAVFRVVLTERLHLTKNMNSQTGCRRVYCFVIKFK